MSQTIVDADTHICEPAEMWELLPKDMRARRPVYAPLPSDTVYGGRNAVWLIDGNIFPKPAGKGGFSLATPCQTDFGRARTDIEIACREINDPLARVQDMDRLNVDLQVVYPTLFLVHITDDVALEVALSEAYNRFLAGAFEKSGGRIRWVVVPPLKSIEATIQQMRYGKDHGAVGLFMRGIERDRTLDDPYFGPIYEEAQRLDLPICIHTAAGCPAWTNIFTIERNSSFPHIRMLPLIAFRDLIHNRIPEQFPKLRFGFIEAGASWVPYVLHALRRQFKDDPDRYGPRLFEDYRFYVACEVGEDIGYLARYIGEDHLIIGSDYGHTDPSTEPELVTSLRSQAGLASETVDKILGDNARALYALA
ncbi:MAG TPA: amidohydrolase family protein [Chloroflexota bacterium]|nr:amidohydrolase family protein [Chloroflexota bacterium]